MKLNKYSITVLILFCFSLNLYASKNINKNDKTLFLTLTYDGQSIKVDKAQVVNSSFKQKRLVNLQKAIRIDLTDVNAEIICQEAIDNPLIKIYEVEDPDNQGKILKKVVTLPKVTFSLRLPYSDQVQTIEMYETEFNSLQKNKSIPNKILSISRDQIQEKINE